MPQPDTSSLEKAAEAAIAGGWTDPFLATDLVTAGALRKVTVTSDGGKTLATIAISLGYPAGTHAAATEAAIEKLVEGVEGIDAADVTVKSRVGTHSVQQGIDLLPGVKNIIAVASGKGGVGKSTVSVNLALALSQNGATVGILDADIYGPSQPRMLGASGQPDSKDGKSLEPMMSYGLQSMSIGYLIDETQPMIWRGPMVTQALEQLLKDTTWKNLDYLVIDLPPGTGDTQLTLSQKIPVSGAIIVTTPQDIALLDARKGLAMFEKVKVPVLGVVENMSTHVCTNCGHEEHIFGSGGGAKMAEDHGVALLGQLPLDARIRADGDAGQPTVVQDPDGPIAENFRDIARHVAAKLSLQAKDYRQAFPKIEIVSG